MNKNGQKVNIPLDGKLDLTRNKVDISQFTDFEEKNSPIYGEALSPLYSKKDNENKVYAVYNTNGDKFTFKNNILYKNDEEVMQTKGTGYFSVSEVTGRQEWDTYDIDGEHTLKSKYEHGIIKYYYDDNEYTFSVSSISNAVINCRSRIVNGTPITAYVFATPAGTFQFVYLSKNIQQSYIGTTKQKTLKSSQVLAETTAGSGTFFQNRGTSITTTYTEGNDGGKGFLNPLIQISNPLENVYVVSFLTNHGGKIDPETDLGYFNILNNNGTFYNSLDWDTSESQIELAHEQTISIIASPSLERENVSGTCYAYEIPSGNADYDKKHENDVGKFFKTIDRYGNLKDQIFFDPNYNPEWTSSTSAFDSNNNEYIQYQTFSYTCFNDVLKIENTIAGLQNGDTVKISLPYDYKIKHNTTQEIKAFNNKEYLTQCGAKYTNVLYDNTTHSATIYKKKLIKNTGTDQTKWEENNKLSYNKKPLWNIDYDDTDPGNPLVKWESSGFAIKVETGAYNEQLWWEIKKPVKYVRRNIHSGTAGRPYEQYPVVYSTEDAYHEATVGETYEGEKIQTEADTYELDVYGNKIPIDLDYYTKLYGGSFIYEPMDEDKTAAQEPNPPIVPQFTSITFYEGEYIEEKVDCNNSLYRTFFTEGRYVYWTDDTSDPQDKFETTVTQDGTVTWQFAYENNSEDWDKSMLWGGFTNTETAVITLNGQDPVTETVGTIAYNGQPQQLTKTYQWTTTQSVSQIMTPTVFLDDGSAISTGAIQKRAVLPISNILCFQARVTGISNNKFSFNSTGFYQTQDASQLGCVLRASIDLSTNYFRTILSMSNGTNSTAGTVYGMQILYDSASGTYCNAGGLSADTTTGSGWFTALFFNNQGSIAKGYNKWRYLINSSGLVSGLSYGNDDYIGTLLTEWNSISEDKYVYYDDTRIGYHSTDGKWYEIELHEGTNENISIIFDRYIVVPTNGFWNCYDIERGLPLHYATDFNIRVMAGVNSNKYSNFVSLGRDKSVGHTLAKFFVSGVNSMYEVSDVAVTSIQISPQAYINIATGYETFPWCKSDDTYQPQYIEVFAGINTDATSATYQYSTIRYEVTSITLKDSALVGLDSPVAVAASTYYSPNIFTEFIHTYNNKDLVKNGKYGYPIVYNETTPVLSYSSGKQISNVDSVFVIQSQFYALIGGKIVSITYDDYTVIGIDAIIDVSGMKYLGYLPTKAYFWSPANRSLYSFTGDANLSVEMEANGISEVYETYYSTQKEALFIATNRGVYVISDVQQYHIDTGKVKKIWFINDGYFIAETDDNKLEYFTYEKNILGEDAKKIPVKVETKYYGPGNGQVVTIDKVSIMFRSDYFEPGKVKFSCSTMTDAGFKSEEKTISITADQIDKINQAFMINYTPKWQSGQGFAFSVESDFPIVRMTESVTELAQNTSTKHNL